MFHVRTCILRSVIFLKRKKWFTRWWDTLNYGTGYLCRIFLRRIIKSQKLFPPNVNNLDKQMVPYYFEELLTRYINILISSKFVMFNFNNILRNRALTGPFIALNFIFIPPVKKDHFVKKVCFKFEVMIE